MMASQTQASSANYAATPCAKCGAKELQRKPRQLYHKFLALYPYTCLHCKNRETKFRMKIGFVIRMFFLIAIPMVAAYFVMNPGALPFRHQDDSSGAADALSRARTTAGGLSTFEQMVTKKPRTTMDNSTVLKLWKANVGTNVILQLIRTTTPDYDVSATSIIELKEAGVDQSIILAMIDASYANR